MLCHNIHKDDTSVMEKMSLLWTNVSMWNSFLNVYILRLLCHVHA